MANQKKRRVVGKFVFFVVVAIGINLVIGNLDKPKNKDSESIIEASVVPSDGQDDKKLEAQKSSLQIARNILEHPEPRHLSADMAYHILKDSGLIKGEAVDGTETFDEFPGVVKSLRTDEVLLVEFETGKQAKTFEDPDFSAYVVNNLYILIKEDTQNAHNFIKVLYAGEPLPNLVLK
ncbi:hypothetical protein U8V72_17470 [Priestia filamentosa]|uniref:hypothetical protein n=1 Tax=Priestia filamentosa TaxID=1402861 RepID=UPI0005890438